MLPEDLWKSLGGPGLAPYLTTDLPEEEEVLVELRHDPGLRCGYEVQRPHPPRRGSAVRRHGARGRLGALG